MINLTVAIAIPNVGKYECVLFDLGSGRGTMRFYYGGGTTRWTDMQFVLSDVAGACSGLAINPSPVRAEDSIINAQGGASNSFTNARNAYRGAANHAAGLRAIEGQGLTDGWIAAALTGT